MSTRLERSTTNRVVAGVCGGIAEYLQVDATLVRVFFVIGTIITGGLGLLGYIILIVLMSQPGKPPPIRKPLSAGAPRSVSSSSRWAPSSCTPTRASSGSFAGI